MSAAPDSSTGTDRGVPSRPFRRAVLRGLAVVLPPLLTIVIFLWVWNTIQEYVLVPLESGAREMIVWYMQDIHDTVPAGGEISAATGDTPQTFRWQENVYFQVPNEQWVPVDVYEEVSQDKSQADVPLTGHAFYRRYVELHFLKRYVVVPVFLLIFILSLYLLGKFLAAGMGRFLWGLFERVIHRLPIIRNVYGSVKQVTDFVFSEREIEFSRVVAVEYPRKGIWSIGFVTGESFLDIRSAANEPVLSVLMPTSPMPATGFTITIKKSETIDLNISIDQAFQFCLSCGVVIPPSQQAAQNEVAAQIESAISEPKTIAGSAADSPVDTDGPPSPPSQDTE